MIWSKFTKKSDFLHFNEIWLMFRPIPMYQNNAIQLYFLVRLFWYLSQWSGSICSIFCTRLHSKNIHCVGVEWNICLAKFPSVISSTILGWIFVNTFTNLPFLHIFWLSTKFHRFFLCEGFFHDIFTIAKQFPHEKFF